MKHHFLIGIALIVAALGVGGLLYASSHGGPIVQHACTLDAMVCPDGTTVGRTGPNCEFAACPPAASSTASSGATGGSASGKFCGGIAAITCPGGYACQLDGGFPDAGGHCVVEETPGILSGTVSVGPICPVERVDSPCPVPPDAYTSREVDIYDAAGKTLLASTHLSVTGTYQFSLAPGKYTVNIPATGVGGSQNVPHAVTIKANQTTVFNFAIDTGIR